VQAFSALTMALSDMSETGLVVLRSAIFGGHPNEITTLQDRSNVAEALRGKVPAIYTPFSTYENFVLQLLATCPVMGVPLLLGPLWVTVRMPRVVVVRYLG
jgi:hypothetical protein